MDPIRYFVCCITVGTFLCIGQFGSVGSAALHHLMEYLAGNPSFKIRIRRGMRFAVLLSGYADADWGNSSSSRSTTGMVMLYNKAPIMWKWMQQTAALSTAEAE